MLSMALFVVGRSRQCSEAVMKEPPSAKSVGPGSKVTPMVFGAMISVLLPCSPGCTRSEPRFSAQTAFDGDGDGVMLSNWSAVGASIATNNSKLSLVAVLNEEEIMLSYGKWERKKKKKSSIQVGAAFIAGVEQVQRPKAVS